MGQKPQQAKLINRAENHGKTLQLTYLQEVLTPALHNALRLCRQSALSSKVQAEEKQHIEGHMSLTKEGNLSSPSDTESGRQMPESNEERALQTCQNQQYFCSGNGG